MVNNGINSYLALPVGLIVCIILYTQAPRIIVFASEQKQKAKKKTLPATIIIVIGRCVAKNPIAAEEEVCAQAEDSAHVKKTRRKHFEGEILYGVQVVCLVPAKVYAATVKNQLVRVAGIIIDKHTYNFNVDRQKEVQKKWLRLSVDTGGE